MTAFAESTVEHAALAWLEALGWQVAHGPDISPVGDTLTPALSRREMDHSRRSCWTSSCAQHLPVQGTDGQCSDQLVPAPELYSRLAAQALREEPVRVPNGP